MAVLDWLNANQQVVPEELQNNPQALSVIGEIANSVPPAPVQQEPVQEEGGFLSGFMDGLTKAVTNPDVINSLSAFGAAMGNDRQGYDANMNAYVNRLDARRQEAANAAAKAEERSWQEKQAYTSSLYDSYTPESVAAYLSSGDPSVLVQNARTTYNQRTLDLQERRLNQAVEDGDLRQSKFDYARAQGDLKALDALNNKDAANSITLADGTVVTAPGRYNVNGVIVDVEKTTKGLRTKMAGQKTQEQQQKAENAGTGNKMVNRDIQLLTEANNAGNTGAFTGQVVGRTGWLQDIGSSFSDQATRDAYNAGQRIQGYMENQGIGAARDMGASGINTVAEAERFFKSMPRPDYTSPQALDSSLKSINQYILDYNAKTAKDSPSVNNEPAPTGSSELVRRKNRAGEVWEGTMENGRFTPMNKIR